MGGGPKVLFFPVKKKIAYQVTKSKMQHFGRQKNTKMLHLVFWSIFRKKIRLKNQKKNFSIFAAFFIGAHIYRCLGRFLRKSPKIRKKKKKKKKKKKNCVDTTA